MKYPLIDKLPEIGTFYDGTHFYDAIEEMQKKYDLDFIHDLLEYEIYNLLEYKINYIEKEKCQPGDYGEMVTYKLYTPGYWFRVNLFENY